MSYESPTAEQLESVVDSEETDQLDGSEDTDVNDDTEHDDDDQTNADDDSGEDTDGEDESGDDDGGSDGEDDGNEDDGDDSEASDTTFKIGETEYKEEDLAKIIDEHKNNANWSKSNTEKAQAIATNADQIKAIMPLFEAVAADADSLEILQDMAGITLDKEALDGLREVAGLGTPDGQPSGAQILQAENSLLRFQMANDEFRNDPAKFAEFMQFNVDQKAQSLEQAHTLWKAKDADSRIKAAEEATAKEKERADAAEKGSKNKNSPPAPTGKGAKKINTTFKPSADGTYDDARNFVSSKMKDVFS